MSQTKHIASQSRSREQIRFHIVYMIMSQLNEFPRNQTTLHITQCAMVRFLTQYCHKHNCSDGNDYYLWPGIGKYTGERRNRLRFWWITIVEIGHWTHVYRISRIKCSAGITCYYKGQDTRNGPIFTDFRNEALEHRKAISEISNNEARITFASVLWYLYDLYFVEKCSVLREMYIVPSGCQRLYLMSIDS